jgi:hypothetical protein
VQVAADTIKASLDKLQGFPRTQIGFITFDSTLHFYNLKVHTETGLMNMSWEFFVEFFVHIRLVKTVLMGEDHHQHFYKKTQ